MLPDQVRPIRGGYRDPRGLVYEHLEEPHPPESEEADREDSNQEIALTSGSILGSAHPASG